VEIGLVCPPTSMPAVINDVEMNFIEIESYSKICLCKSSYIRATMGLLK